LLSDFRMTLPLAMYVRTLEHPSSSRHFFKSAIGTLFLPPTLMPRRSTRKVFMAFIILEPPPELGPDRRIVSPTRRKERQLADLRLRKLKRADGLALWNLGSLSLVR